MPFGPAAEQFVFSKIWRGIAKLPSSYDGTISKMGF